MDKSKRLFLTQLTALTGAAALSKPFSSAAAIAKRINTLHTSGSAVTFYHTSNLLGSITPVYKGMGGLNNIHSLLKNQEVNGLLLDAGNFINPSNSLSHQKQVISLMNAAGYHAAAVGANELSQGQDHLASLAPMMKFNLVNCNLEFNRQLAKEVKPYVIMHSGSFKVGITGVCAKVKGIKYNDAIESANRVARFLKEEKKCDLVVCLSHLGYKSADNQPDNAALAKQSENIDLVIGDYNGKPKSNALVATNKLKEEVILSHTSGKGLMLGKTVIGFDKQKQRNDVKAKHFIPGMPADQKFVNTLAELHEASKASLLS